MSMRRSNNRDAGLRALAKGVSAAMIGDVDAAFKQCGHNGMDYNSFKAGWLEGRYAFYAEMHEKVVQL
jgi:hypothetical protein